MLPFRKALQRSLTPLITQTHHLALPRMLSTPPPPPSQPPTEADIVRDLRQGNFARGVQRFCKRPRAQRSNALHETLILACAQVPDARAAEAVLRAMPRPTPSAAAHAVTAHLRERNVPAALDLLDHLLARGSAPNGRTVAAVSRAAQRDGYGCHPAERERMDRLSGSMGVAGRRGNAAFGAMTAADFFAEDGGDSGKWLDAVARGAPERTAGQSRRNLKKIMATEAALRAARGDVGSVEQVWQNVQRDERLRGEVGIVAAAVSAFVSSGCDGSSRALNALMTWVHEHLYDESTGKGYPVYADNTSAMALLVTSASKAIAAAARPAPRLALSAFDALWKMELPRFSSSLPLAGAYFKVLQHAELSLSETRERIDTIRRHHIQLDEQGFSMALGAILRCNERVVDKLAEGRLWLQTMRGAGIPLTVQSYNLFAGQLRYCNDPEMVSALLSDMTNAGVIPTPVTYGLVFSACVIPGEYSSTVRKNAVPVSVWERVLEAMQEHMIVSGVSHTANSRLSLARAYAHLGRTANALKEFDQYLRLSGRTSIESSVSRRELQDAYGQMVHNFAHCRECSADGPGAAVALYEQMREAGFPVSGDVLDALFVACARTGKGKAAVEFAAASCEEDPYLRLSPSGLKHFLMGHIEVCDPEEWRSTRQLVVNNVDILASAQLLSTVQKLVISFARNQHRNVCDDVMTLAGIEISDLDYVLHGREFLRFRSHSSHQKSRTKESSAAAMVHAHRSDSLEARSPVSGRTEPSRRALFNDSSILPLT